MATGDPIDGDVLILASAKASVGARLPTLVDRAQDDLGPRLDDLRRRYETVHESTDRAVFLVERGFWADVGERLGVDGREADGLRRAHEEQLRHLGRRTGRLAEFETALEIREAVVVGT